MNFKKTLFAVSFAATSIMSAQEEPTFSLSGEFRPRTEWRDGFNYKYQPTTLTNQPGNTAGRKGTDGYINTDARVALNSTYKTKNYTLYTAIQTVLTAGERKQIDANGNGKLRIQEAWADIKLGDYTSLKLGRQPLSYDDQRILGGLGWAQQARTHDVGVFKYNNDGYSLDLGYGYNTDSDNVYEVSGNFSYRKIGFAHANKKYGDLNVSALVLYTEFQNDLNPSTDPKIPGGTGVDDISALLTAGVHLDYKTGIVGLSANGFIQNGDRIFASSHQEVDNAFLASLDATIKASEKITVLAGGEIISGATEDGTQGFFPLYGTNHKFNGLMDRFFVGNHAVGSGLIDLNLGLKTSIKGYGVTLKAHSFAEESRTKNTLGQELDLVVAKQFKGFKVVGGYSQFFENDDYPGAEGKDTQNWAWLMLIIKPKFL